jgi:hypothetical protein
MQQLALLQIHSLIQQRPNFSGEALNRWDMAKSPWVAACSDNRSSVRNSSFMIKSAEMVSNVAYGQA